MPPAWPDQHGMLITPNWLRRLGSRYFSAGLVGAGWGIALSMARDTLIQPSLSSKLPSCGILLPSGRRVSSPLPPPRREASEQALFRHDLQHAFAIADVVIEIGDPAILD